METTTVKITGLISAMVRMDNSLDEARAYDIASNVNIGSDKKAQSFDGGTVTKDGAQVAIFSCWGGRGNLSISYQGVEPAEQAAVLEAVTAFMDAAEEVNYEV